MKPFKGTLYKRAKGRYLSASSKQDGRFYYQFPLHGVPRNQMRVCLQTEDAAVAEGRAMVLTGLEPSPVTMNLAEAIALLLRVVQTRYGQNGNAPQQQIQPPASRHQRSPNRDTRQRTFRRNWTPFPRAPAFPSATFGSILPNDTKSPKRVSHVTGKSSGTFKTGQTRNLQIK